MKAVFWLFKKIWQSITLLRNLILNIFVLLLVIAIISSILSQPELKQADKEGALVLAPTGYLVDQKSYQASPMELLGERENIEIETSATELVELILAAKNNQKVKGIVLNLNYLYGGGLSKLEEIGQALESFKQTGKPVIAVSGNYSQQQYYLASYADEIYLNELGTVFLTGYGTYRNYLKDAADKLSIDVNVFRVGEYKDAIEPFTRNNMSEASREHNQLWVSRLWQRYTNKVESLRGLNDGDLDQYIIDMPASIESAKLSAAQYALEKNLVDMVATHREVGNKLIEKFGTSKHSESFAYVSAAEIQQHVKLSKQLSGNPKIGLIVAQGAIYDGYHGDDVIGSESFSELLEIARNDDELNALVIRVDSPGGSAFASEVIRQDILELRERGLPVYISMGSVAASGGYWMATAGDEIWATPSTITGSIGVFGIMPNFTRAFTKLGISTDGVGTTPLSDAFRPDRTLSPEAKSILQSGVENIYSKFLSIVAESRNQSPEHIHQIAQGRVWSGENALELGLIDNLGTLQDVLTHAASEQGLNTFTVKTIRRPLTPSEQFMMALMQEAQVATTKLFNSSIQISNLPVLQKLSQSEEIALLQNNANKTQAGLQVYAQCVECVTP